MLPFKQGYDNVPPSREKSAVSPGTAQSGRRIWRKYRAVCAYRNVPPDTLYHYGSFSRKIISWNISSRPNADLVIQTFQKAYHTRNCPAGLMFHSDRGSQYITFAFRKLLDELNVVQSFSKKAYPFDNACCESFFKYLKKEETNRRNFRTYRDLYHSVFQYIKDFYNSRRPHGSLGYLIPDEMETTFWERQGI